MKTNKKFILLVLVCSNVLAQQNTIEKKMQRVVEYRIKQAGRNDRKVSSIQTVTYSVDSIGYAPYAEVGTPILIGTDDIWSAAVGTGFNFCFFGSSVDSLVVGANGQLTFDVTQAGGYNNWPITTALPNAIDMPGNTICGPFRDIDPSVGGNTYYQVIGSSPNRIFAVSWASIPLFNYTTSCPGTPFSNFQIALHESTNTIEVFIANSSTCSGWNGGYGIIGIQDATAANGICPPNRNYPNVWTAVNEAWRFSPISGPCFTTNVHQANADNSFRVYPNPFAENLTVNLTSYENKKVAYTIFDITGNQILSDSVRVHKGDNEIKINTGSVNKGIYFLNLGGADGKTTSTVKVVK